MAITFTIIDMEFTGARPTRDRIVELAMVKYDAEQQKIIDQWHSVINPERKVNDFLVAMMHFNQKELENAPFFGEVADKIMQFTENSILVGLHIRRLYALLRQEFKRAEQRFQRQHICMSKLIHQNYPLSHPRTLSSVCGSLDIKFSAHYPLPQRAETISSVFEQLFIQKQRSTDKKWLRSVVLATKYPPNLPREKVESLPHAMGVYYFLDRRGRILYLGKSKDIKKRILSHFNTDLESGKKQQMKALIYDIHYRLTGSELIALLLESDEIKRYMPAFNRAQRRKKYTYGIYLETDAEGYECLQISTIKMEGTPIIKCSSRWQAVRTAMHLALHYGLCLSLCGLQPYENLLKGSSTYAEGEFVLDKEPVETHNQKIARLTTHYSYPHPNMLLLDKGRTDTEQSVVFIENNQYLGYAYVPNTMLPDIDVAAKLSLQQVDALQNYLIPFRDNPDVQRIIRAYLRKGGADLPVIVY